MCHYLYRYCLCLDDLFKSMFNDGEIANKLALSKTKCAYLINHGKAPFYMDILLETSKILPYIVFSFDKSLNSVFQWEQMNCLIKYWNDAECQVETRYLDSKFQSHSNSGNLLEKLPEALVLGIYKLIQVSIYSLNSKRGTTPIFEIVLYTKMNHLEQSRTDFIIELQNISDLALHLSFH